VVSDERRVELVVSREQFVDIAVEESDRSQHRLLEDGDASRLIERRVDVGDDLSGGAGLGVGEVPHASEVEAFLSSRDGSPGK
jgi:hypothetical protein